MDLLQEVEETIGSEEFHELLTSGDTDSLSGTATKMYSLAKANRLVRDADRTIQEVIERCTEIAQDAPDLSLDDGTTPAEVKARALLAKAKLLIVIAPAMYFFKRKRAYGEAVETLERSIRTCPIQESYLLLGFSLSQLRRADEAAEAYRRCIDMNPDSDHALEAARMLRKLGLM